ncbi:MAG: hypothetical protein DI573_11455 [Microbacterium sp.]|nr:MAG: hypothetical protein DI573_11455 [Microbacterium sp.]
MPPMPGGQPAAERVEPVIDPARAARPARRGVSRREVIRWGLIGVGGLAVGGLGGFAIGRSTAPSADAPHPIADAPTAAPLAAAAFPISLSADARGFVDAEGSPFFYLADTPWNAISRMTRESFTTLATARRDSGFTGLQMSVLDFDPRAENAYGHAPFAERGALDDPLLAEDDGDDYWSHVAWCIDTCAELGLVACLVPSWYGGWGDSWRGYVTADNAGAYGAFLADRFGDRANVWWLLGGDNDPSDEGDATSGVPGGLNRGPVIEETIAMGRALREGAAVTQLMSYHTARRMTVEEYFGGEDWYDISAAYSGEDSAPYVAAEYARPTVRPVVLWESYYEARDTEPMLDRRAVRAQAYHALMAGAAGIVYGHELVYAVADGWVEALASESSGDMGVLSAIIADEASEPLVPVSDAAGTSALLPDGYGTPGTTSSVGAVTLSDGRGALVYVNEPRSQITVDTTALHPTASFGIRWINPATGEEFFVADDRTGDDVSVGWPSTWSDAVLVIRR